MLNFEFSRKGLGLVSPSHFVNDFSRKIFLILYSINWPTFIVWLSLFLEISGNMCIVIACWPVCDVVCGSWPFTNEEMNQKTKNRYLKLVRTTILWSHFCLKKLRTLISGLLGVEKINKSYYAKEICKFCEHVKNI